MYYLFLFCIPIISVITGSVISQYYVGENARVNLMYFFLNRKAFITPLFSIPAILLLTFFGEFTLNVFVLHLIFFTLMLIGFIDFNKYIIPNPLLLALLVIILYYLYINSILLVERLLNSLFIFMIFYLSSYIGLKVKKSELIGMGDLKFIAILSLIMNFSHSLIAIWISSLVALIIYLIINVKNIKRLKEKRIPFGPFLALGYTIMFICCNNDIGFNLTDLWK